MRAGRSSSDGPPPPDVSCRTARQGWGRRPLVGPEVPSYLLTADSHATRRDNLSDVPSPRGGLASVLQGSASHHESPPVDAMVEGKPCTIPSDLAAELNEYARVTREIRYDIDLNGVSVAAKKTVCDSLSLSTRSLWQTMLSHCWRISGDSIL